MDYFIFSFYIDLTEFNCGCQNWLYLIHYDKVNFSYSNCTPLITWIIKLRINVITGGVTSMEPFLKKFFPVVYRKTKDPGLDSNYCKYDNQGLQLFTSSLYLAGLTATFFASYTTRKLGRRLTMLIAGVFFIFGTIFNAAAQNLAMLIIGRILLGCGVGFANQVRLISSYFPIYMLILYLEQSGCFIDWQ